MIDSKAHYEMQESLLSKDTDSADGSEQGDYGDKTWGQSYLSRKRMTGLILGGVFFLLFLSSLQLFRSIFGASCVHAPPNQIRPSDILSFPFWHLRKVSEPLQ